MQLGSTDKVWENLMVAAEKNPIGVNLDFSYLTIWLVGNLFVMIRCDCVYLNLLQ